MVETYKFSFATFNSRMRVSHPYAKFITYFKVQGTLVFLFKKMLYNNNIKAELCFIYFDRIISTEIGVFNWHVNSVKNV